MKGRPDVRSSAVTAMATGTPASLFIREGSSRSTLCVDAAPSVFYRLSFPPPIKWVGKGPTVNPSSTCCMTSGKPPPGRRTRPPPTGRWGGSGTLPRPPHPAGSFRGHRRTLGLPAVWPGRGSRWGEAPEAGAEEGLPPGGALLCPSCSKEQRPLSTPAGEPGPQVGEEGGTSDAQ